MDNRLKDHKSGRCINYYENRNIKEQGDYFNGEKNGIWLLYDENGNELRKEKYIKGWREGNPLRNKTAKEIVDILGGEEECFFIEEPEGEEVIDKDSASLFLKGSKFD